MNNRSTLCEPTEKIIKCVTFDNLSLLAITNTYSSINYLIKHINNINGTYCAWVLH